MNVYEKLLKARSILQGSIKQNGKNDYAKYTYFELSDILPAVNKACEEVKALAVVSFTETAAILDFIDIEKPENKINFTSPMSRASLKGCHEVQNLGAVETYLKRYLYQHCFEIAESDQLNAGPQPQPQARPPQPQKAPQMKNAWTPEKNKEFMGLMEQLPEERRDFYRGAIKTETPDDLLYMAREEIASRAKAATQPQPQPQPQKDIPDVIF